MIRVLWLANILTIFVLSACKSEEGGEKKGGGDMAQNNNQFPNNLQQLVDGGHIREKFLTMKRRKITYIKGLTPNDTDSVILYTTPDKNGKAIYATVDGAVRTIHHFELEELIAEQEE